VFELESNALTVWLPKLCSTSGASAAIPFWNQKAPTKVPPSGPPK